MIIYLITNLINDKKYVGKTCNFMQRYQAHFGYHSSKDPKILYKAMNKYGKENFQMSVIEECDDSE